MSPASRKRKPKKSNTGKARPPRVSPLAEIINQALDIKTLVQARTWASDLLGYYRHEAWLTDNDPEITIGQLQFEIADVGGAAGTAAALALSLVGRRTRRAEFFALGEKLALASGSLPAWTAGDLRLRLRAAHSITDASRDTEGIALEYDDCSLAVVVDHIGLIRVLKVLVLAPGGGVEYLRDLATSLEGDGDIVELTPAEVSYRLFGPVTTFEEGPSVDKNGEGAAEIRKVFGRLALLEAVLTDLPQAPVDRAVVEQFVAECGGDEKWSRWWADFVVGCAEDTGRAATDFGNRFAHVQIIKMAREVRMPAEDVPAVTEAIRAWARFTNADWTDELPDLLEAYAIVNAHGDRS